jgi:hypothetical protein
METVELRLLSYQKIDYDIIDKYFSKTKYIYLADDGMPLDDSEIWQINAIRRNENIFFPFYSFEEFDEFYNNGKKFADDIVAENIDILKMNKRLIIDLIEKNYISEKMEEYLMF